MKEEPDDPLRRLRALVARLRGPEGCPWDREQTLADVRAYLLEEAHEVAAAIDAGDLDSLAEELGDLLFLTVFTAELASEEGAADIHQVAAAAEAKMVARHPHVFGDEKVHDARAVRQAWGRRKLTQRTAEESVLGGVPASLPALLEAYRMTQKAADVGFDWPQVGGVLAKLDEELAEVREALAAGATDNKQRLLEELGDLLFTVANLARYLDIDPDAALTAANGRFRDRFQRLERKLAEDRRSLSEASLQEMSVVWEQVKATEE